MRNCQYPILGKIVSGGEKYEGQQQEIWRISN